MVSNVDMVETTWHPRMLARSYGLVLSSAAQTLPIAIVQVRLIEYHASHSRRRSRAGTKAVHEDEKVSRLIVRRSAQCWPLFYPRDSSPWSPTACSKAFGTRFDSSCLASQWLVLHSQRSRDSALNERWRVSDVYGEANGLLTDVCS
jgi:hypothetical protein